MCACVCAEGGGDERMRVCVCVCAVCHATRHRHMHITLTHMAGTRPRRSPAPPLSTWMLLLRGGCAAATARALCRARTDAPPPGSGRRATRRSSGIAVVRNSVIHSARVALLWDEVAGARTTQPTRHKLHLGVQQAMAGRRRAARRSPKRTRADEESSRASRQCCRLSTLSLLMWTVQKGDGAHTLHADPHRRR
jgi:hypothetical protein